ncbi:MAG: hypothetical protein IJW49_06490 [Clostridia bacterium]|nr:hypothetical protein [Clostridia bacterium]
MIKGAQKQMIVLRTADSRYFDEAYFVLRRELPVQKGASGEMLFEADRILREGTGDTRIGGKKRTRGFLFFCIGFFLGCGAAALSCWLLL